MLSLNDTRHDNGVTGPRIAINNRNSGQIFIRTKIVYRNRVGDIVKPGTINSPTSMNVSKYKISIQLLKQT